MSCASPWYPSSSWSGASSCGSTARVSSCAISRRDFCPAQAPSSSSFASSSSHISWVSGIARGSQ